VVLLQVFIHRALTPEQGQLALAEMLKEAAKQPTLGATNTGAVRVAGYNRFENDFPQWLQQILTDYKLTYDSVNLCYQGRFNQEANAEAWRLWFERELRPYMVREFPSFDSNSVHVRVMTVSEDVANAESF
jgi:hypothetical protein